MRASLEISISMHIYIYTWTRHQGRIVVPPSSGPVQAFSWGSCRGPLFDPRDSVEHFLPYPRVFFEFCSLLGLLFITNRHYFSYVFSCDATCANRAPVWAPARFCMFQGCLPWCFLMHNLRLRLDSFFVRLFCIVFDILGVSGCTFGTAVAPWGAVGPPTRASPW